MIVIYWIVAMCVAVRILIALDRYPVWVRYVIYPLVMVVIVLGSEWLF